MKTIAVASAPASARERTIAAPQTRSQPKSAGGAWRAARRCYPTAIHSHEEDQQQRVARLVPRDCLRRIDGLAAAFGILECCLDGKISPRTRIVGNRAGHFRHRARVQSFAGHC